MNLLFRFFAIFSMSFKRLWVQKWVTIALVLGITAAVTLVMTIPLYADAVFYQVLQERIETEAKMSRRPPFAYVYQYVGSWHGALQLEDTLSVDAYFRGDGQNALGLPLNRYVRYLQSSLYKLFPEDTADYSDDEGSLGIFQFGTASDFENQIELLDGRFPQVNTDANAPIEVLVLESTANELGFQTGDRFIAFDFFNENNSVTELPVSVAGIWRPIEEKSDYWFTSPFYLNDVLFVDEATFVERLAPILTDEVDLAIWYLGMDGNNIDTADVDSLLEGSWQVIKTIENLLPNTTIVATPTEALTEYRDSTQRLQLLLVAFNVPFISLVLAFIILVVGLVVDQRRNEIAVLRSRGATPWQIIGIAALEGIVLGLLSFLLGTLLALLVTQLMGKTQSFLNFSSTNQLRLTITKPALQAGLMAIGLAVLAQILPTIAASKDTIITYKLDQARSLKKPIWQRAWLDFILLAVTLYGFYLLDQQGSIIAINEAAENDIFQNPLLFLLPALAFFSLTLLFLRIFPWLMAVFSWLLQKTNSVGVLMASWELARTPRTYAMPLILLILTVSLAVFTASLAFTLDLQLIDDYRYQIGADANLIGAGVGHPAEGSGPNFGGGEADAAERAIFLPMAEYEEFPGVSGATRVGRYFAQTQVGDERNSGMFLGIDRGSFNKAAFWRDDFARWQLNSLLNQLSISQNGVLVSKTFLEENRLNIGDLIRLTVLMREDNVAMDAVILGSFDYFPTWYEEEDGPLFVGNLNALFALAGSDQPYEVWLQTGSMLDETAFHDALLDRDLFGWTWTEPYSTIQIDQVRPERQGLFGQLSVGFIAAALLTVIGFFMYAFFSFKRRLVSLGILRAVGLSTGQMSVLIGWETAVLILTGLTIGTFLGIWISNLFIPYLQIGGSQAELIPPYLVEIAWPVIFQIYGLFLLMFFVAFAILFILLRRMKIFQAIKLGETV